MISSYMIYPFNKEKSSFMMLNSTFGMNISYLGNVRIIYLGGVYLWKKLMIFLGITIHLNINVILKGYSNLDLQFMYLYRVHIFFPCHVLFKVLYRLLHVFPLSIQFWHIHVFVSCSCYFLCRVFVIFIVLCSCNFP